MRTLVDGNTPLDPAGQLQESTLVVADIFNHEALMDALEPGEYAAVSNRFLNAMAETLVEKGGTLAACDGEGVRVLFGAPLYPLPITRPWPAGPRSPQPGKCARSTPNSPPGPRRSGVRRALRRQQRRHRRRLLRRAAAGRLRRVGRGGGLSRGGLCAANLIYGSTVLVGARTFEMAEACHRGASARTAAPPRG